MRKELEIAIGKIFGPLEETLKNQLEGLIRNCQERLTRDYESSKAGAEIELTDDLPESVAPSDIGTKLLPDVRSTEPSGVMAPYTVPMESAFDPWQGMTNVPPSLQNSTWSESAYFSEINYPLPSDPWWPLTTATAQIQSLHGSESCHIGSISTEGRIEDYGFADGVPYKGKGKGKALDDQLG